MNAKYWQQSLTLITYFCGTRKSHLLSVVVSVNWIAQYSKSLTIFAFTRQISPPLNSSIKKMRQLIGLFLHLFHWTPWCLPDWLRLTHRIGRIVIITFLQRAHIPAGRMNYSSLKYIYFLASVSHFCFYFIIVAKHTLGCGDTQIRQHIRCYAQIRPKRMFSFHSVSARWMWNDIDMWHGFICVWKVK